MKIELDPYPCAWNSFLSREKRHFHGEVCPNMPKGLDSQQIREAITQGFSKKNPWPLFDNNIFEGFPRFTRHMALINLFENERSWWY